MASSGLSDRTALLAAARDLRPYAPPQRRRRFPLPSRRTVAAVLAADAIVGGALWAFAGRHGDSPVEAVTTVATLAGHGDWAGVYDHLCRADRQQFSAADLAAGGDGAVGVLHGFAGVRVTSARAVSVHLVGPVSLPARQVSGQFVPRLGTPVDFTVTTVRELGGWKVCLAVGGYAAPALGVDVPLGG